LAWLTSPPAVAATTGGHPFDVAELLATRGTVYLLGRHAAHTAPLLGALTGYIARESRRLAAHQPGGRLDPPLTLALDEAARIAPVPLPDWTGDAGGSGISIVAAFQSRADVIDRWGATSRSPRPTRPGTSSPAPCAGCRCYRRRSWRTCPAGGSWCSPAAWRW